MPTNLGDLLSQAGFKASETPDVPEADAETPDAGPQFGPKVVLRVTRAGRGGKTVTEIQGVLRDRKALAKHLRKKLGVGVSVDGELLVAQGDQRTRIEPLLAAKGAAKIVLS